MPFPTSIPLKLWNDLNLRPYLGAMSRRYGVIETLALPTMRDLPPVRIETLFVSPLLSETPVAPNEQLNQWPEGKGLLDELQSSPQLVVLGDPGSGKTTIANWLSWRLSAGLSAPLPDILEDRVPLHCVLREMPSTVFSSEILLPDLAEIIAEKLLGEETTPILKVSLRAWVEAGRYALILDGIDEIPVEQRSVVAKWLQQAHEQNACALATSRLVGYDDWPVDRVNAIGFKDESIKTEFPSNTSFWNKELDFSVQVKPWEMVINAITHRSAISDSIKHRIQRSSTTLIQHFSSTRWAKIRYLMPFDQSRINAFSENWYRQRCSTAQEAKEKTADFLASVAKSEVTKQLARTPNLLSLMAIVHRERAHLPDGKAELYDQIANAYINTIDQQRRIMVGDALAHFDWNERQTWLAYVAFQMQQLRSDLRDEDEKDTGVLVSDADVLKWLSHAMRASDVSDPDESAKLFLGWVARRSGLLLPRGEGRYAFVHLSFQEYFCACYLKDRVQSISFIRDAIDEDAPVTKPKIMAWGKLAEWRETLIFLFELLSIGRGSDYAEELAVILFGPEGESNHLFDAQAALAARAIADGHIRLSQKYKDMLANSCVAQAWSEVASGSKNPVVLSYLLELGYAAVIDNTSTPKSNRRSSGSNAATKAGLGEIANESKLRLLIVEKKSVSDISQLARLSNLQALRLGNTKVSDIAPLSGLAHLRALQLSNTKVTDITPLSGLTKLEALLLEGTKVSEIAPLSGLTNLQALVLDGTKVSDIAPLAGLTNLLGLHLNRTKVSDIQPLAGLTNLQLLHMSRTKVSDIQPLAGWTNLEVLHLDGTKVSDITPLSGLTNLEILHLDGTKVSNITPLSGLTNLEILHLDGTKVSDITPLSGLTNLQLLSLVDTQVADIAPLSGLTNLALLALDDTQVADIAPLSGLTKLESLFLDQTQVSDITALSRLINLEMLSIGNKIGSDITALSRLKNLEILFLDGPLVSDITPLSGLNQLRRLYLENTQVVDIAPLSGLTQLRVLSLRNTQVADIAPLSGLAELETLFLESTKVTDIAPLSGLTQLRVLSLRNTQVTDIAPLSGLTKLKIQPSGADL